MSASNVTPRTGQDGQVEPRMGRLRRFFTPRPGGDPTLGPLAFAAFACVFEALLIALSGLAIAMIYVGDRPAIFAEYLLPVPLLALASIAIFNSLGLYDINVLRRFASGLTRLASAWTIVFLMAFTLIFFLKMEGVFSRVVFGSWYATGLVVLVIARLLIARLGQALAAQGLFRRRAILVGGGPEADAFLAALKSQPDHDLDILGLVDDRTDERSPPR